VAVWRKQNPGVGLGEGGSTTDCGSRTIGARGGMTIGACFDHELGLETLLSALLILDAVAEGRKGQGQISAAAEWEQ